MLSRGSRCAVSLFELLSWHTVIAVALSSGCAETQAGARASHAAGEHVGASSRSAVVVGDVSPASASAEVWDIEAAPIAEEPPGRWKPPAPVPLAQPLAVVPIAPDDPEQGEFTLEEAARGLAQEGQLLARLTTDRGVVECELWPHRAPITVANFVGLARGLRPFKDPRTQSWTKRPAYDGTVFHRVIRGFMIQGGDPLGNGTGTGGYVIPDENWVGATHDAPGLLCMATSGPNTGGMQFFITDRTLTTHLSYLDGSYTVFGECLQTDVVERIASVETNGQRPVDPPRLEKVEITREMPGQ